MELGLASGCLLEDKRALVAAYKLGTRIGEFVRLPLLFEKSMHDLGHCWQSGETAVLRPGGFGQRAVRAGAGIGREEPQVLASGAATSSSTTGAAGDGGRDALDLRERRGIVLGDAEYVTAIVAAARGLGKGNFADGADAGLVAMECRIDD